jgi:hypothetical protein
MMDYASARDRSKGVISIPSCGCDQAEVIMAKA